LTEACFLISRFGGNCLDLVGKVVQRSIEIGIDLEDDAAAVVSLMRRYADTPMSLADACLVRLSERLQDCLIFTLDEDFEHYRRNGRHVIPLLRPS
jgi:predicted nucleic acid-binding protein